MSESTNVGIEWVQSLTRFGIVPGLERTERVLMALGNPHRQLSFFHVAGTNGKGSVCAFLTGLLSVNKRVGTFTSPAFDGYRARFMVDGVVIDENDFARLAVTVMNCAERVTREDMLTEFEALTVMAILYFVEKEVEAVVWETGLGGRYDSTNVVSPLVTAITNVSLDHTEILGSTKRAIAYDKAGIIKPGVPLITATQDEAYLVIERIAREVKAPLWRFGVDFVSVPEGRNPTPRRVSYRGKGRDVGGILLPLVGRHQLENFAIALAMHEVVEGAHGWSRLSDQEIRTAIHQVSWPGRFELLRGGDKPIILDGAHNPAGAFVCAETVKELARYQGIEDRWTVVLGILGDKDAVKMVEPFLSFAEKIIFTEPDNPRATDATDLERLIRDKTGYTSTLVVPSVELACQVAVESGRPILIAGSLYTVDEARKAILSNSNIWKSVDLGQTTAIV